MSNTVLCVQCGKWHHSTYAKVRKVTATCSRNLACRKFEENIREADEMNVIK